MSPRFVAVRPRESLELADRKEGDCSGRCQRPRLLRARQTGRAVSASVRASGDKYTGEAAGRHRRIHKRSHASASHAPGRGGGEPEAVTGGRSCPARDRHCSMPSQFKDCISAVQQIRVARLSFRVVSANARARGAGASSASQGGRLSRAVISSNDGRRRTTAILIALHQHFGISGRAL